MDGMSGNIMENRKVGLNAMDSSPFLGIVRSSMMLLEGATHLLFLRFAQGPVVPILTHRKGL